MGTVEVWQCSCKHLQADIMRVLLILAVIGSALGVRKLKSSKPREEKSLLNTFPFNAGDAEEGHHHHHHNERQPSVQLQAVDASQRRRGGGGGAGGSGTGVSFGAVAAAGPGADGRRCIDKVDMVEETEYDDVVQCDHSYDRRCHTTYVTNYESQQEEECEENFRKNCFINYEKIAFNETVEVCRTPLVKDCDVQGPEICRTEYESECWTKQEEHDVEDDVVESRLRLRRSVRMKPLATQPTPSAPSGLRRCALWRRSLLRSSPQSLVVPRNQERSVLLLDVGSRKERRSVMIKHKLLSRMLLRNSVLLSPREPANMSPNLSPSWSLPKSVLMFLRRFAQGPRQTQGRSRSQLSRNGATFQLRNLDLPNLEYLHPSNFLKVSNKDSITIGLLSTAMVILVMTKKLKYFEIYIG